MSTFNNILAKDTQDGNESDNDEDDTPYVKHSTGVRHRPNNLLPNMAGGRIPYEEGA